LQYLIGVPEDITGQLQQVADATIPARSWLEAHAAVPDLRLMPPAFADARVAAMPPLNPDVKYLYGADGEVLRDMTSLQPLQDDWWNKAVGVQASIVRGIDQALRYIGVPQAFGWTILVWTFLFKLLLYPLEEGSNRTQAMMQMLDPKVKEIKEKFKDNNEEASRRIVKLYEIFEISATSVLGSFAQLPFILTLFYAWRRLGAEKFEHFSEPWLWIPSLSQPNPDFNFNLDWLLQFSESGPVIGWNIWIRQLILPAILISFYVYKALIGIRKEKNPNLILIFLPTAFISLIALEFPQLMGLYYLSFNLVGLVALEISKAQIRSEVPAFAVFEKTGKFPEGNFDEVHFGDLFQASAQGNLARVEELVAEGVDVNARNEEGMPALFMAAASGNFQIVAYLSIGGADLTARDSNGNTVLHVAALYDNLVELRYLSEFGKAQERNEWVNNEWVHLKNDAGLTVLDMAKVAPEKSVLQYLNSLDISPDPQEQLKEVLHSVAADVPAAPAKARRLD